MLKSSIIVLSLFLVGCKTMPPAVKVEIQKVEIPIEVPCKTEFPKKPEFKFGTLSTEQDIYDKTQILLADRNLHIGYEIELEAALKSCKE